MARLAAAVAGRGARGRPRAGGVEPGSLYSLMREESSYRPDVVSIAGARGLLQLMPEHGERVARALPLPELHRRRPLRSRAPTSRLGARYLASLLRQFAGRASAAIGSYNAGPARGRALGARAAAREDDEWVEEIPYEQTRAYVKRVLRSLHAYRVLY